eukprot:TRINITY_DN649_c2_g1_i1.p1 TRINITY_DN649_c2_g1~~TRINITY_DN649_c2_g1_i1.p1  ORF type:complete len:843 (-),score=409.69 TRINITY_DN649_c2_g1_i1:61-2589(-)
MISLQGILAFKLISAEGLEAQEPYAVINVLHHKVARSKSGASNNPVWNQSFDIILDGSYDFVEVEIWDNVRFRADTFLGHLLIPSSEISEVKKKVSSQLHTRDDKVLTAKINFSFKLEQATKGTSYKVKNVPFNAHKNCKVTLYQDAHVGENCVPRGYESVADWMVLNNAYEDIYSAILGAKKFIYITGWSVYPTISLLRRRPISAPGVFGEGEMLTIEGLLKKKSNEGVVILLHLWDEKLSVDFGPIKLQGLMATADEQVKTSFAGTNVKVQLSYRVGSMTGEYMWTHHQKTVIVDASISDCPLLLEKLSKKKPSSKKRRIIAFVGGLDLTEGRWDTPDHSLFRTLFNEHQTDFHQACAAPGSILQGSGPREPWHDIHSKVEGVVARDVLTNFEQRWRKQAQNQAHALYNIAGDPEIIDPKLEKLIVDEANSWTVQLFRSIDKNSADGIVDVDKSIQQAYLNAIRAADEFLYIENQYFMGSCFAWAHERDAGCYNGVPLEIATKIVENISKNKRFAAYILVPMYPEGVPISGAVQEVLRWQFHTMEMMYHMIGEALMRYGPADAHPCDYLTFFCLGNREDFVGSAAKEVPKPGTLGETLHYTRRFPIYVHSKMMIVDDEYIMVGSANINDRSLAGNRDTEICIGAYQPAHTLIKQKKLKSLKSQQEKIEHTLDTVSKTSGDDDPYAPIAQQRHRTAKKKFSSKKINSERKEQIRQEYADYIRSTIPLLAEIVCGSKTTSPQSLHPVQRFRLSLWAEHTCSFHDSFLHPESVTTIRMINAIAEENWVKYYTPEINEMNGHFLNYPVAIAKNGDIVTTQNFFPDTQAKVRGSLSFNLPNLLTT